MDNKESMGGVIRRFRTEKGWTQEELAGRIGVSAQAVSKWETGQSLPDISQVPLIARAFDISTDALFGMEERDPLFPEFDHMGTDPEKAWETWQEMRRKIGDVDGLDKCVWNYVYAGFKLCCPAALTYHPGHAAEVLPEILRFGEKHMKMMEKAADHYRYSFVMLMIELYGMAGIEKKAVELAGKAPPYFGYANPLLFASVYRGLGQREVEAGALATSGSLVSGLLLDITARCAENALSLGRAEDAFDAASFGIALVGLLGGAMAEPPSPRRDDGSLEQQGARALLLLGRRAEALEWLRRMVEDGVSGPPREGRGRFFSPRDMAWRSPSPRERRFRLALLRRDLAHPDFDPLRGEPEFQALLERVEAEEGSINPQPPVEGP